MKTGGRSQHRGPGLGLLMEDVSGHDFTMHAIAVDSTFTAAIGSTVRTNGARSWPGSGDVSWQPVFP